MFQWWGKNRRNLRRATGECFEKNKKTQMERETRGEAESPSPFSFLFIISYHKLHILALPVGTSQEINLFSGAFCLILELFCILLLLQIVTLALQMSTWFIPVRLVFPAVRNGWLLQHCCGWFYLKTIYSSSGGRCCSHVLFSVCRLTIYIQ